MSRASARIFGWQVFHGICIRRRVVFTNLKLCFPKKFGCNISVLARAHYDSLSLGLFAKHVLRAPEQYFWVHKLFKARGPSYLEIC